MVMRMVHKDDLCSSVLSAFHRIALVWRQLDHQQLDHQLDNSTHHQCQELRDLHNMLGMAAVLNGLQKAPVARLKSIWVGDETG